MNILALKRQLFALSGPQGDSGGGGGGSGTQTQINELPEWARPYAKDTLERGAALTDKKFQKYGAVNPQTGQFEEAPRIAGFSPMQLTAQQNAANMQTSGLTGLGGQIAGSAALGALGTGYQPGQFQNQFQAPDPYQSGRFRADRVGTQSFNQPGTAQDFMSPYMQNVVDVQQREARRASQIAGQGQQAEAVGRGAFGGSRDALMRAERERNLATQLGDIQATGQQAAFNTAQQQFNTEQARNLAAQQSNQQARLQAQQLGEQSRQFGAGQGLQAAGLGAQYGQAAQQLGEQSRQYGAGLGMQGLQTALQGAGQLGTLGGQEFQQGMDINKLQSAYGGQQQALRQQGLDLAYQDFQNEQNYPYKQLGFMSDLIRGLPLGTQSTQQVYQGPGSLAGQVAGLGMGAYGLSKLSNFMAEGGEVHGYADGGSVESEGNIQSIVSKLSDQQLQQAMKAAQARGDADQLDAIQKEMAMRASERSGMAGAFNSLPQENQDTMMQMAGGGVVAFADEGLVKGKPLPERETSVLGDIWRSIGGEGAVNALREYNAKTNERDRQISAAEDLYPGLTSAVTPEERKRRTAAADRLMAGDQPVPKLSQAELAAKQQEFKSQFADKDNPYAGTSTESFLSGLTGGESKAEKTSTKGGISSHPVVRQATEIAKAAGIPQETFEDAIKRMRKEISSEDEAYKKEMAGQYQKAVDRLAESKKQAGTEALMQYGFGLAKEASKPGARFMGSVAGASPILSQALMESNKVNRAAEDNIDKMRMDQLRLEQSMRRGDYRDAAQMAGLISADKKNQQMLDLKRQELAMTAKYHSQAGISNIGKMANEMAQKDPEFAKLPGQEQFKRAAQLAGYGSIYRADMGNQARLAEGIRKINEKYAMLAMLPPNSDMAKSMAAKREQDIADFRSSFGSMSGGDEDTTTRVSGNNYAGFKLVN